MTRFGIVGGAVYLVLTGVWLATAAPPGPRLAYEVWFIALVFAGARLPGVADQITIARAYLALPAFVYAMSASSFGVLASVVAVAGLTDVVDGAVARHFASPTQLGGGLDPVVDGIFFGAVAVGLAAGGAYPGWLAAVVVLRYAVPAAAAAVLLGLGRRPDLRHSLLGQFATAAVAILLGLVALLRGLGQDASAVVRVAELVIPLASVGALANLAWDSRHSWLGGRP